MKDNYNFVTKIGELLHFNIIEYKNLYRALIDGYYYLNNQLDNEKCIRDELKKFYNEESDNYLNKLLYSILSCSEYLYGDELNEIIGIYERNYNTIIPNTINELSCSYYHTPFAEDFVNKNIKIEFECVKRKSFISISKYDFLKQPDGHYYRNIVNFDKSNKPKFLHLYYFITGQRFFININDNSNIKNAVDLGQIVSNKNNDEIYVLLTLLKNANKLEFEL